MKKFLLIPFVWVFAGAMQAQNKIVKEDAASFISFHAGPSFPIKYVTSTNPDNTNEGLSKTGCTLDISYGYEFQKYIGFAGSIFYNMNQVSDLNIGATDYGSGHDATHNVYHYQQNLGFAVGPMFTFDLDKNIVADFRFMTGLVKTNAQKINGEYMGIAKEEPNSTAVFQTGINLHIGVKQNLFVVTGIDFRHMEPKFNYSYTDANNLQVTYDIQQKISLLNVNAGVGLKF